MSGRPSLGQYLEDRSLGANNGKSHDTKPEMSSPINISADQQQPATDLGNARRLVAEHGKDLLWAPQLGAWLTWNGHRWSEDVTGEADRRANSVVDGLLDSARDLSGMERDQKVRHYMKSSGASRLRAMVDLAKTEPSMPVTVDQLDGRLGERRSPLHANVSGSHTHRHPANQSQGSWKTHTHEHAHDGDASHTHDHDALAQAAAEADAATDQAEDPTETMSASSSLSASEWDFEARVRIAKAKVALADASHLTPGERWALGLYDDLERRLARRLVEVAELRSAPFHSPMIGQHFHVHGDYGNVQAAANKATNKRPTGLPALLHAHSHVHGADGVPDANHDHDHGPTVAGSAPNPGVKTNQIVDQVASERLDTKKVGK